MEGKKYNNIICLSFLAILAAVHHLLYGHLSFNPTDEGFILAMSRRLADGAVPHLDFISIRPVLSSVIHIPELLAGQYTLYVSRFISRLQFVVIVFLWMKILLQVLKIRISTLEFIITSFAVYLLSVFTYNLMAWHTVDGIFFSSIGIFLVIRKSKPAVLTGYFILGLAYLCKQNFLLIPFAVWLFYDLRRYKSGVVMALLPALLYMGYIYFMGGFPEFLLQMKSETSLWQWGFLTYLDNFYFIGGFVGSILLLKILKRTEIVNRSNLFFALMVLSLMFLSLCLVLSQVYIRNWQFFLYEFIGAYVVFGYLLALILVIFTSSGVTPGLKILFTILLIAWSASVSVGYHTPVFFIGIMTLATILGTMNYLGVDLFSYIHSRKVALLILIFALIDLSVSHHFARREYNYRDKRASLLNYPLKGIFPGAAGLFTNETTFNVLEELKVISSRYQEHPIVIVPEFAAFWIQYPQQNILPIDWPAGLELQKPELLERTYRDLVESPENTRMIVQKHAAGELFRELDQVDQYIDDRYRIVKFIQSNYKLEKEYAFFKVYRK